MGLLALVLQGCVLQPSERTEILWDTWGVPHIYGRNAEELFYAFGWAQMHSHGDLVLRLYGQARGRAAEYWGPDYRASDRIVRVMGVPERARRWDAAQDSSMRRYLTAFVQGMNDYAAAHPDQISDERAKVLPVRTTDIQAHLQRAIHLTFVSGLVPGGGTRSQVQRWAQKAGSNAWALAPTRTASGEAMLLANPHLPWSDLFTWYEAQLTAPGVDAYGATLVGLPTLAIAFNDYLGWTHTVNTFDGVDLYELTLTDDGYAWDGGTRAFEAERDTLRIRQKDGSLQTEDMVVRRSVHGPVLRQSGDKALAVRIAGLNQPHLMKQYWDMMQATTLDEFEAAYSRLQLPMFNTIYADVDGHILYHYGGRVPKRPKGDWAYWQGIVPGNTSETLWTRTLPYKALPRVHNPPSGWVQNANDPPWTSTFPRQLNPENFPAYLSPRGMAFRPQRSAEMLTGSEEVAFSELEQYKHSTRMGLADRILDDLLPAARQRGSATARQAAKVLDDWDRMADADSRGAVLFAAWAREVRPQRRNGGLFATTWSPEQPRTTPDGLANPAAAVDALERAASTVKDTYGALDVAWGEVYRLQYAGKDLPANGGSGALGIFRVLWYEPMEDNRFRARGGDSYVALVKFSDPVQAHVLLGYGNATQPESPHRGDQLELFARKELRPAWRTRDSIRVHLERRKRFETGITAQR